MAPCDAAKTGLPDKSVDYHVSNAVFEHIPLNILKDILKEGNRIVKKEGLFIHNIDYSDHFAYDDKNISAINFLQYSDKEWAKIAGNRHAYVNRLRHDDFISLFESAGHEFLQVETQKKDQQRIKELLEQGNIRLSERFTLKTNEILSTTAGSFVSVVKV
jgi:ubiquinone/menaquinone biosynthesis C-methylase UbiE